MSARTTLADVAAAAGVSRSTASRVLAGTDRNVDERLAKRVLAVSEQLGYRTNPVARALRRRSTDTFGILVPSLRNPYFVQLVDAFTRVAGDAGLGVVLADSGDDPDTEAARLDAFHESFVDGIVVVPTSQSRSGTAIRKAGERTRIIQLDRWSDDAGCGFVGIDNHAGVQFVVEHLRSSGRERIAYVGAEQESSAGAERLAAFRALSRPGDTVIMLPRFALSAGHDAARRMLGSGPLPDAAMCAADVLAVGMLSTLQREGVDIPADIAITGFDGTDLLELVNPSITTLHHRLDALAQQVVGYLVGEPTVGEVRIQPELVVRGSTAPGLLEKSSRQLRAMRVEAR
jgi:LacI family transcriptional regulator